MGKKWSYLTTERKRFLFSSFFSFHFFSFLFILLCPSFPSWWRTHSPVHTCSIHTLAYSTYTERGQWKCMCVCVCVPAVPCTCKLWRTFESIFDDCLLLRNQAFSRARWLQPLCVCVSVCHFMFMWVCVCMCLFIGIEGVKGCCYGISHPLLLCISVSWGQHGDFSLHAVLKWSSFQYWRTWQ